MKKKIILLVMIILIAFIVTGCDLNENIISNAFDLILKVLFGSILKLIVYIGNIVMGLVVQTSIKIIKSKEFLSLYKEVLGLVGALYVVGFVLMSIFTALGYVPIDELRKTPQRIAFSIFEIALAPAVIAVTIIYLNKVSKTFLRLSHTDLSKYAGENLFEFMLAIVVLGFIYLFMIGKLTLVYAYRNYAMVFYTLIAPVIFVVSAFPFQQAKLKWWFKEMWSLLLTQTIHALQLALMYKITILIGAVTDNPLPQLLWQIGGLIMMIKTPQLLKSFMNEGQSNFNMAKYLAYNMAGRSAQARLNKKLAKVGRKIITKK